MANNQKKLKAFVRYDGSGRVVASSLILRKNKPRVGRWVEIPQYLCCNGTGSTTTTTTNGGGVTPTAFIKPYWTSVVESCNSTTFGNLLFYSASTTITEGITVFTDANLTIPVTSGRVISSEGMFYNYVVGAGGLLTEISCAGQYYFGTTAQIACSQSSPAVLLEIATDGSNLYPGTTIYTNFAPAGFSIGQTIYIRYSPGFAATRSIIVTSATTATVVGELNSCP